MQFLLFQDSMIVNNVEENLKNVFFWWLNAIKIKLKFPNKGERERKITVNWLVYYE